MMRASIKTKRLVLRPADLGDVPAFAALAGDWDVARMTARIPYPYSEDMAREWITSLADGEVVCSIDYRDALIGAVGYMPNGHGSAEIGYWIGRPWWGRGFATEAASALVRHCFLMARFRRVTCSHFDDNPASRRVIEKLGFSLVGSDSAWCDARQHYVPTLIYVRDRPVWARFWRLAQ